MLTNGALVLAGLKVHEGCMVKDVWLSYTPVSTRKIFHLKAKFFLNPGCGMWVSCSPNTQSAQKLYDITYVFNDNSKEIFLLRKMTTKQDLHDVVCRVVRNGLRVIKAWDLIFM